MAIYTIANGIAPLTAAFLPVETDTVFATMLQVKLGDSITGEARVVEWGISFNGSAAATPFVCELLAGNVAATVTAHAVADLTPASPGTKPAVDNFPFAVGVSDTGFTSTAEGTLTATRFLDGPQLIAPTGQFVKQVPLGQEGLFDVDDWMRIRIWGDGTITAACYVKIEV